jgi:predicted DNA-binding transcriptional regulator YafY
MRTAARPLLARLATIDEAIRSERLPNARTLARNLEVNPRTIQRDLQFPRDRLGTSLTFDQVRNGYYYTDTCYRLPYHQLSEGELLALFLAERLLQEYRHTPYANALASAFAKITIALPEIVTIDLAHHADRYANRQVVLQAKGADETCQ